MSRLKLKEEVESGNLAFVMILYVVVTLMVFVFIWMEKKNYGKVEQSMNTHDSYLKDVIFMSTFDSLKKGNMKLFNELLKEVGKFDDVVEFSLVKPNGKISYSSLADNVGRHDMRVKGVFQDTNIIIDDKSHFYFPVVTVPYCTRCHTHMVEGTINSYYKFVLNRKAQKEVAKISLYTRAFIVFSGVVFGFLIYLSYRVFDRRRQAKQLEQLAYFDSLTGLPNRKLFYDRLDQAVAMAERHSYCSAVLFIDLDDFKTVNDTMGHNIGDLFLKEIARRLLSVARTGDTVARLGGDEFIVLINNISDAEGAGIVAERIIDVFKLPYAIDGKEIVPGASIGISIFPGDGDDPEELLHSADLAMYNAKNKGKGQYAFYQQGMDDGLKRKIELEKQILTALDSDSFFLVYQPIIDLEAGETVCFEALLRWDYEGEIIMPDEFLPIAEKTGFICDLGRFVAEKAISDLSEWKKMGYENLKISFNISARQFLGGRLVMGLGEIIRAYGLNYSDVMLEIKESYLQGEELLVRENMEELHTLGIGISLDDFGTGYSSLSYLRDFPLSNLKIDGSFLESIHCENSEVDVVTAVVKLAESLDMTVTAEGVETAEQLKVVADSGCRYVQGFYFAQPDSFEKMNEYLEGFCNINKD